MKDKLSKCASSPNFLPGAGGFTPRIKIDSRKGDVCLVTDATLKSEAYKLEITIKKITIRASDLQGFYYALQSIRQLLPSAIESEQVTENVDWTVPALTYHRPTPFRLSGTIGRCGTFFLPQGKLVAYYRLYGNAEVEQVTSASGR